MRSLSFCSLKRNLLALILMPLLQIPAWAKPTLSLIDLISLPSLSSPRLSPDGNKMLYVQATPDWTAGKTIRHLWLADIKTGAGFQLTNGARNEGSPRWSPTGERVAFLTRRQGDDATQIYIISLKGGEASRVSDHPTAVTNITWAANGQDIYFIAEDEKSKEQKAQKKDKDDVYAFDENFSQKHLWRINITTGQSQQITTGGYSVRDYALNQQNAEIIFLKSATPHYDDAHDGEIWTMSTDGQNQRQISHNISPEKNIRLSPKGDQILYLSWEDGKGGIYNEDNLFLIDKTTGDATLMLADFDHEINEAEWSRDGKSIYFIANMGVKNDLFKLNVKSGKLTRLTDGPQTIRAWHYSAAADDQVFSLRDAVNKGDFYHLDHNKPRQITSVFSHLKDTFDLPKQEVIHWTSIDGTTIEGLLTYPNGYHKGTKYALAVQTHGGPMSSDQYGIFKSSSYIPALAAKGYFVLQPNYRGSVGYGDAFVRDMVGGYFTNAHLDVMSGVDHLIALGLVDDQQMVKMGWSAGGHMTNKIVTFTDRFKAASSGAGASNWISMYGQTDIRRHRGNWFGGTPWSKDAPIDIYWQNSPLRDAWKVKTPTLILVGEEDPRVPMPQSVEFYRALKANGVDTHLYVAPRTGHGWRELRHRLFKMNVEMEWFEKHARQRDFTWEEYPAESDKEKKPDLEEKETEDK